MAQAKLNSASHLFIATPVISQPAVPGESGGTNFILLSATHLADSIHQAFLPATANSAATAKTPAGHRSFPASGSAASAANPAKPRTSALALSADPSRSAPAASV